MKPCLKVLFIAVLAMSSLAFGQSTGLPSGTVDQESVVNAIGTANNNPVSNTSNGTATSLSQQLSDGVQESQNNNETYYQNALANPSVQPGAVIQPSAAGAMIATPDGPEQNIQLNLTDQEKKLSEEYVHDGRALRMQEELCGELDPSACRGTEVDNKFMGIDAGMVMALSKAYTMVVGMMGVGGGGGLAMEKGPKPDKDIVKGDKGVKTSTTTTTQDGVTTKVEVNTNADGATTTNTTTTDPDVKGGEPQTDTKTEGKEEKDGQDYCKYIAIGIEAVALFQSQQSGKVANIPANQDTAQKEVLYKAARSHKDRAKTHNLQFVGWGATTACYVGMILGPAAASTGNILKLAGAGLMTWFFKEQADHNEEYYKKVKGIADQLPGKGDCNPVTEKDCYCSEETTMNDPAICLPQFHNNKVKLGNYRVACIDANAKVDPKCTCIDADACLDKRFMNEIKPFGFGTAFNSAATRPLSNLARGQLTAGDIASARNGSQNAFNQNGLSKIASQAGNPGGLNSGQQKTVQDLNKLGMPPKLAAFLAKSPTNSRITANGRRFRGGFFGRSRSGNRSFGTRKRRNVLNFRGGGGINKKKRRRNKVPNFMSKFNKKGKSKKRGKVLNYQDKAMRSAQINKDKNRPIFEIISRRYKVSGYKRLNVE